MRACLRACVCVCSISLCMLELNSYHYSLYRKLPTDLAQHGKCLAATLLRRILIENILDGAQSNYYKYAISDLKKANEFALQVTNWHAFNDQKKFMDTLKAKHPRKVAFWSKITEKSVSPDLNKEIRK